MIKKYRLNRLCILLIAPLVFMLGACEEDETGLLPEPEVARIMFIHAQDFGDLQGDNRYDSLVAFMGAELRLPYSVGALAYTESTPYVDYPPIFQGADPRLRGAVLDDNGELSGWSTRSISTEDERQRSLVSGASYTFMAVGSGVFSAFSRVGDQGIFMQDDLSAPSSGQAKLRVIHGIGGCTNSDGACIAAPVVDVSIDGDASNFQDLDFVGLLSVEGGDVEAFVEISAGQHDVLVEVDGGGATILDIDETFEAGGVYTLVLHGLTGLGTQDYLIVRHD